MHTDSLHHRHTGGIASLFLGARMSQYSQTAPDRATMSTTQVLLWNFRQIPNVYNPRVDAEAIALEKTLGVHVIRHQEKKPAGTDVLLHFAHFRPSEMVMVGDRVRFCHDRSFMTFHGSSY